MPRRPGRQGAAWGPRPWEGETMGKHLSVRRVVNALLLLCAAAPAFAQETTGSVRGTVTDPQGAVVAGATVTAAGPDTVRPIEVATDDLGRYGFLALKPGAYAVTAAMPGFRPVRQDGLEVNLGKELRVDFRLEVGGTAETVTVSAEAALVNVTQSQSAVNVSKELFETLPRGRGFQTLIVMAPGARFESAGGGYQIDGASGSENVFVIDGVQVNNFRTGTLDKGSQIPFEFVQEFQVKSSGFEAEHGGATGGVVNVVTRGGGNQFHGQATLYLNRDNFNARPRPTLRLDPFAPVGQQRSEYFQNEKNDSRLLVPGFALGGPVLRDKLWFFASLQPEAQRTRSRVQFVRRAASGPGSEVYAEQRFTQDVRTDYGLARLDYAPWQKLRLYGTFNYSPYRLQGSLPSQQGTGSPDNPQYPYRNIGNRQPNTSLSGAADYTATNRLLFGLRLGYHIKEYHDRGIPNGTRYLFSSANTGLPAGLPVPGHLQHPSGWSNIPANQQTEYDTFTRVNLGGDGTYIAKLFGRQHSFKAGYQMNRLNNRVLRAYSGGLFQFIWNRAYTLVNQPGGLTDRGLYGYYYKNDFRTDGDVASFNHSLFLQDQWQFSRRLTLNLGVRAEREYLPSFNSEYPGQPILFGFGKKLAPRLGFAYDVRGDGRWVVRSSYSHFFDLMKYEMPRGAFGGDKWKRYYYTLDDPDFTRINLNNTPGGLIEVVDGRIPSNSPGEYRIDPDLRPMQEREFTLVTEYQFTRALVGRVRYVRKWLTHTIEDLGIQTREGEKYFIANPGVSRQPVVRLENGQPASPLFPGGPDLPATPRARRVYDGLEFGVDKRLSKNFGAIASYTYSRLWGNYGGLASSDENGRLSPNVNRYFDLPFMSYDSRGKLVEGLLATDRPHTVKFFGSYILSSKLGETNFAPTIFLFSGTPLTTEVNAFHVPVFANGRGDLGRTPFYSNFDLLLHHEVKVTESKRVRFEANFTNLFNQNTITNRSVGFTHGSDNEIQFKSEAEFFKGFDVNAKIAEYNKVDPKDQIRRNPAFGLASGYQPPRVIRFGVHFIF